jgi:hypothetical protein
MTSIPIPPPTYTLPPDLDPSEKPAPCASGEQGVHKEETAAGQGEGGLNEMRAVSPLSVAIV